MRTASYHLLWNAAEERRHRRRNRLQSVALLLGMAALLSACGWIVAGAEGVLWALAVGAGSLVFSPRLSPGLVLRLYRAQPIPRWQMPEVYAVLEQICAAAGLARMPPLYYLPAPVMNAFAVGNRSDAAIAITDGMLRGLDLRELAGVLAHEISHIRNGDILIMGLADILSRLTRLMALFGLLLLLFSLPLLWAGGMAVPWVLVLLLVVAPVLGALMQLGLSRTREFDADLDAAGLTGDPVGLAAALRKIQQQERGLLARLLLPPQRREPSLLRSHPLTGERIRRLLALQVPVRILTRPMAVTVPRDLPDLYRGWLFPGHHE